MDEYIFINKPAGWTSHDVVAYLRRQYPRGTKVGHAGTLDPFATGLLIVGVGRNATKKLDEFKKLPKTYETIICLGATSDTQDKTGVITPTTDAKKYSRTEIETVLQKFLGTQTQIPPMYSAKKIHGQKLYTLARRGIKIERQPQTIVIYHLELLSYDYPYCTIRVVCSTGTYIRTLSHDIGKQLGGGAYCQELKRVAIGDHSLTQARDINIERSI